MAAAGTDVLLSAAAMALVPSSVADAPAKSPKSPPIGVRAPFMIITSAMVSISNHAGLGI
jgi:hypothetical protein